MANIRNIDAESGANYIGDDAEPTLTLDNTSTGAGLLVKKLAIVSGASLSGGVWGIDAKGGNVSLAPLTVTPSATASVPFLVVQTGGFASITSTVLTSVANTDYAIRVRVGADAYRWIPLFKDAALVGTSAV